jgi:Fe-S-cluster containining protein
VEIGPVPEAALTTIEEHRLYTEVEGAESAAECVTARPYGEMVGHFMKRVEGRCVMLTPELRCAIHAAGGPAAKPGVCRQFPYTFTRGRDAIYVSLQMECRSLSAALHQGAAEDHATLLAELRPLAEGPLVHALPDPVRLSPGIYLDQASYLQWWDRQRGLSLPEIAAHAVGLAQTRGLGEEPEWLRAGHWETPPPIAPAALRARLWEHVTRAVALMTQEAAKERRLVEQEQAELLRKALLVGGGHVSVGAIHWLDEAGPALLERVVTAAMAGHDVVRDCDLLYGLGRLALIHSLTLAAARLRAVQAGRVALTAQDVNDGLVATNVILRTPYVEQTLRMADAAVRSLALPESDYAPWMGVPHPNLLPDGPSDNKR